MIKWDEKSAKASVERNGGKIKDRVILITNAGIKVQGAVDYLVNYCNYIRG